MVLRTWKRWVVDLSLLALVLAVAAGVGASVSAPSDPALVFGADAGVVLTFVLPDRAADFDRTLARFRTALEESDDPIRRQQAENWRIFKSPDPGPEGSVLYVGFMEPVLKGANYNIADIMLDELPEGEAEELIELLQSCLSEAQSTLNLEDVIDLGDELPPALAEDGESAS